MSTPAQIAANQRNAQRSSGPTSETGKAKSSLNAVKTGLTGRAVLLPSDDAVAYESHVAKFHERHQPATDEERTLVQSLADTQWRLLRIPALEAGIYAIGRLEFAELFPNEDEAVRAQLIESKVFLTYQRQLNNLCIQESRLRRQFEKDAQIRKRETSKRLDKAARQYIQPLHDDRQDEFDLAELGSEFSLDDIEVRAMEIDPDLFAEWEREQDEAERIAA